MYPYIDLKLFKIPTYGLMIAISIIAFYFITTNTFEKKENQIKEVVDRILIVALISFVILGVSAYLMNSLFHSIEEGKIDFGGFTWLGGVIIAFPIAIILFDKFCKGSSLDALTIFEYILPGMILAHGIGRIGCFLAGCCYGGPTDSIFGISYPKGSEAWYNYPNADNTGSLPLWPTQLFETAFDLTLFAIIMIFRKNLKGYCLEIYCFSYGVFRFLLEYLRADDRGGTGFILTPSQLMSVILILGGVVVILYKKKIIFKKKEILE